MDRSTRIRFTRTFGACLLMLSFALGGLALPAAADAHNVPHPSHIHTGDCSAPGEVIAPLNDLTVSGEEGTVSWAMSSVELTLDDILGAPHSIVVHESADNMGNYLLCGDLTGDAMEGSLTVALGELNGSGYAGVATLTGSDAGTDVTAIAIPDANANGTISHEEGVAHPSHIHDGACEMPGEVVFPLSDFTGSGSAESSTTDVEASLDDVLAAPHSIIAHASSDDMGTYVVCGDVTGEVVDDMLVVTLNELNNSGHVGVAVLSTSDAGITVTAHLVQGAAATGDMGASPEAEMGASAEEGTPEHDMAGMDGEEVAAEIEGFAFLPGEIEVKVGTTITWTNLDSDPHTVTANDRSFDSGRMEEGDTFSFTFDTVGSFEYFCEYHPGMTGTVVVTE